MSKKVTVYTSATNPETGEVVQLAPGDEAPSWASLGDHVFAEQGDSDTPTEPVAGSGQSAFSKQQLKQLDADIEAAKGENGETGNDQTRTSGSSSATQAQAKKS